MMMTSRCTKYYQVLLAQGICIGLGSGLLFTPGVSILPTYFTTKKITATAISAMGSSFGGILYPLVFFYMQPKVGYPWAVRTLGFLMVSLEINPPCSSDKILIRPQIFTCALMLAVMRTRIPTTTRGRKFWDPTVWTDPPFMLFTAGLFVGYAGVFTPFFYITNEAQAVVKASPTAALALLLVANATSALGRVSPGPLADKIGPLNVLTPAALVCSILLWCWIPAHSLGSLFAYAALFGLFSG